MIGVVTARRRDQISLRSRDLRDLEAVIMDEASVQDRLECRQPRLAEEPPMELTVEFGKLYSSSARAASPISSSSRLRSGDKGTSRAPKSPDDGPAFDLLPEAKHLDRLLDGAFRHPSAAMALPDDKSFLLKLQEGLAHGVPGCSRTEPRARVRPAERRGQLAQHDVLFDASYTSPGPGIGLEVSRLAGALGWIPAIGRFPVLLQNSNIIIDIDINVKNQRRRYHFKSADRRSNTPI